MRDIKKAIELIKKWEGFRTKAYKDPVGIWTIGYGTIRYPSGKTVQSGDVISEHNAENYLLEHIEDHILGQMHGLLRAKVNENQYSALVSFTYNLGIGNLKRSTLLKKINNQDFFGAAREFDKWVNAGGKKLKGLVRRRADERKLFETPIDSIISHKDPTANTKKKLSFWARIKNFICKLFRK